MKIICFGDSITRGVSYVNGRLRILKKNYPTVLQKLVTGNSEAEVVNKGVFNDTSDLLVQRLGKDVLAEKPNCAIIGVGGNDCNFKWDEVAQHPEKEHDAIVPIDRYLDNIKKMSKILKQAGITPVILTLPPLDPVRYYQFISDKYGTAISHWISTRGGIEHWHSLYNRSLKKWLGQSEIPHIDVRTSLKKAGDLCELISEDGIHLTEEGYKAMGKIIYEELNRLGLTAGRKGSILAP